MKIPEIKKTDDHSIFGGIIGNRPISPSHVKNLVASIGHKNMLPDNPINVNEKMQIIDGQHRLEAAKELGLPIYYLVMQGSRLEEIQMLNTTQKRWGLGDMINSYCSTGKKDYVTLRAFHERYGFPYTTAAMMLSGGVRHSADNTGSGEGKVSIWSGNWKVKSEDEAMRLAEQIVSIKDSSDGVAWKQMQFVVAFMRMLEVVSFDRFQQKLKVIGVTLEKRRSIEDYLRLFEEIVNYHVKEKQKVRLF